MLECPRIPRGGGDITCLSSDVVTLIGTMCDLRTRRAAHLAHPCFASIHAGRTHATLEVLPPTPGAVTAPPRLTQRLYAALRLMPHVHTLGVVVQPMATITDDSYAFLARAAALTAAAAAERPIVKIAILSNDIVLRQAVHRGVRIHGVIVQSWAGALGALAAWDAVDDFAALQRIAHLYLPDTLDLQAVRNLCDIPDLHHRVECLHLCICAPLDVVWQGLATPACWAGLVELHVDVEPPPGALPPSELVEWGVGALGCDAATHMSVGAAMGGSDGLRGALLHLRGLIRLRVLCLCGELQCVPFLLSGNAAVLGASLPPRCALGLRGASLLDPNLRSVVRAVRRASPQQHRDIRIIVRSNDGYLVFAQLQARRLSKDAVQVEDKGALLQPLQNLSTRQLLMRVDTSTLPHYPYALLEHMALLDLWDDAA